MPEIAIGRCWIHRDPFEFDPEHVVTVWVDRAGHVVENGTPGARQVQICDECIAKVNRIRVARGEKPHETAAEHKLRLSGEERRDG